jgi:hypothetical protein
MLIAQEMMAPQQQALNMRNKLNATSSLMHLQYKAQQEKNIQIFVIPTQ